MLECSALRFCDFDLEIEQASQSPTSRMSSSSTVKPDTFGMAAEYKAGTEMSLRLPHTRQSKC